MSTSDVQKLSVVKNNIDLLIENKRNGKTLAEAMKAAGLNENDKRVYDLCLIAFYTSDRDKAFGLMQDSLSKPPGELLINQKQQVEEECVVNPKDAELLKEVNVILCVLTEIAFEDFKENGEEYDELIRKLILQRTYCVNTAGNVKVYDIVPVENRKDDFGSWSYDPFAGHLKLYAKLDGDKDFPRSWKLDSSTVIKMHLPPLKVIPEEVKLILNVNMQLDDFLEQALLGGTAVRKVLGNLDIHTLEGLKKIGNKGWQMIEERAPAHYVTLRSEVDKLCDNTLGDKVKRTKAEELNDWHKVKLFLHYVNKTDTYKTLGMLDEAALELGFKEQSDDKSFDIGSTMDRIKEELKVYTTACGNTKMRDKSHGMMLYGPPGTGKTKLSVIIIKKAGLAQIVEPLSSAELNRSLVGETEKLLMAIFKRATYCPHLLCCVAIDEVDALTPKRNDKAAGHKVDGLSLLLSLIGGIKDVPNVFVIASTNRLNKIDEAFARRLQNKFYIGRLTNKQRVDLLNQIVLDNEAGLKDTVRSELTSKFEKPEFLSLMAKLTTNFSGAALAALRARILIYFDLNTSVTTISDNQLIELTQRVANDFQVKIGRYSVPELMKNALRNEITDLWKDVPENGENLSGRILIQLKETSAMICFEYEDTKEKLLEVELSGKHEVRFVSQLIPFILDFCVKFKVDNIQLLDSDALLTAGASDESAINELFNESFEEFDKYDNGIVVFDVDTLVGINETLSDSSMSPSKSYSVQNHRLWQNILHACKRSYFTIEGLDKRKWCMVISGSEFLIEQYKKLAKFPFTEEEKRKKKEEEEMNTAEKECKNCGTLYFESQNRIDACSYHHGYITRYDNRKVQEDEKTLNAELDKKIESEKMNQQQMETLYKSYYYKCCSRCYYEARNSGCKRNFHSEKSKIFKKYSSHF